MLEEYEEINNIKLIRNNLRHIACEIASNEPSPMRLAKECYQLFLRMMVEALRGTANLAITARPTKDMKHLYLQGDDPWKLIQKENIEGCNKAWRYSKPVLELPPILEEKEGSAELPSGGYLLGFYDLLAMIQTPCFINRYSYSKAVSVPDAEMQLLEWLHENIRNDFEHFIPKTLLASSDDCLRASEACLRISSALLTESRNITPYNIDDLPTQLHTACVSILDLRDQLHDH